MKTKLFVVLFLAVYVQNAEGNENKKQNPGGRIRKIGKLFGICALSYCALSTTDQPYQYKKEMERGEYMADHWPMIIRNVEGGRKCYFEGCYCPHDIIFDYYPLPAYFSGTAEDIYDKYCIDDKFHDTRINKLIRFLSTLNFCRHLTYKAGFCLGVKDLEHWGPKAYESEELEAALEGQAEPSGEEEIRTYAEFGDLKCKRSEFCNCSCSYRLQTVGYLEKKYGLYGSLQSSRQLQYKESTGKFLQSENNFFEEIYERTTMITDFQGKSRELPLSWTKSALVGFKREDLR